MPKNDGDVIITIGATLNKSFNNTLNDVGNNFKNLSKRVSSLYNGMNAGSTQLASYEKRLKELNQTFLTGDSKTTKYNTRISELTSNIKELDGKIATTTEKIELLTNVQKQLANIKYTKKVTDFIDPKKLEDYNIRLKELETKREEIINTAPDKDFLGGAELKAYAKEEEKTLREVKQLQNRLNRLNKTVNSKLAKYQQIKAIEEKKDAINQKRISAALLEYKNAQEEQEKTTKALADAEAKAKDISEKHNKVKQEFARTLDKVVEKSKTYYSLLKNNADFEKVNSKFKKDNSLAETKYNKDKEAFLKKLSNSRTENYNAITKEQEVLNKLNNTRNKEAQELENTKRQLSDYSSVLKQNIENEKDAISSSMEGISSNMEKLRADTLQSLTSFGLAKLETGLKRLEKVGIKAGKSILKLFGKMSGLFSSTADNAISLQKAIRLVVQYGFGFRSLYYLVRRFRTGIQEGFGYLSTAFEEINEQVIKLQEALYYLKSAAATAVQPFLNVVMPLLERLISLFNRASQAIATFVATLTGQDYIYVATTDLDKYANALDKTTGSAKELEKALGAYDKLNVIKQDTTGSGSGGSDIDTTDWFTKTPINPNALAELIKKAFQNADFTEVGKVAGEKLKDILSNINWYDSLDGSKKGIFTWIEDIAKDISTFINGFTGVNGLGRLIGENIANVLNGISTFVYTWTSTLDWGQLGKFISDGINGFLETLNASQYGAALYNFASGLMATLGNIIANTDWENIGIAIGDFLMNLNIPDLISKLANLALEIVKGLASALSAWAKEDPDSFGIGAAILTAIGASKLVGVGLALYKLIKGESLIATLIKSAFAHHAKIAIDTAMVEAAGSSVVQSGVVSAATTIGNLFLSALKIALPFAGIAIIIGEFWTMIEYSMGKGSEEQRKNIENTMAGTYEDGARAYTQVLDDIFQDQNGELYERSFNWITGKWDKFRKLTEEEIEEYSSQLGETIDTKSKEMVESVDTNLTNLENTYSDSYETIKLSTTEFTEEEYKKLYDYYTQLGLDTSKLTGDMQTNWETMLTNIEKSNDTNTSTISHNWNTLKQNLDTATSDINNSISTNLSEAGNNAAESTAGAGETIADNMATGYEGILESTTDTFNQVSENASSGLNNLNDTIYNGLMAVGRTWTSGLSEMVDAYNEYLSKTDQGGGRGMSSSFAFSKSSPSFNLLSLSTRLLRRPSGFKSYIPFLAQGAVIPPNKQFLAVLGDQKSGTNIEAPLDTIKQALAEVLTVSNNNAPIVLQLNGRDIAKVVWDENQKRYKQTGKFGY